MFFASKAVGDANGIFYGGFSLIIPQIVGTLVVAIYTAVVSFILLKVVEVITKGLRVSKDIEIEGLDKHIHGEKAYGER